jgi:membrane-associated phospholipid phosphatase
VIVRRRSLDIALLIGGSVVLAVSALAARSGVYDWEVVLFRAVNDLPDGLRQGFWILNQYGTAVTIPLVTVGALLFRRWLLAAALAVSGVAVYVLARVIKEYVARGRPGSLVADIVERETFAPESLGFPSGHAAVSWAITVIVLAQVGRRWGIVVIGLACVVSLSRMYVGAHVPLDLIGGAALGLMVGSAANLLLGVPQRVPVVERSTSSVEPEPSGIP